MENQPCTRLAIIGGGAMAEAVIHGLLGRHLVAPGEIIASDPIAERRSFLAGKLGIRITSSNREAITAVPVVLLAVKPQAMSKVLAELGGTVPPEVLVLSIVTGVRIQAIRSSLGTPAIVRIVPNTPAQVGEGMSVWTATSETSPSQRQQAREIVGALGQEVYVEEESYLDMATALVGSGPAYVFLFIEALIDAGVQMGFSRTIAEKLVLQTVRGSAIYAQQTGLHPAVLRNSVTSPGGTTAEGLLQLEEGRMRAVLSRAVLAAYQKATALGRVEQK